MNNGLQANLKAYIKLLIFLKAKKYLTWHEICISRKTTTMKKVILLFLLVLSGLVNAQNSYTDLPGRWRLGFNMGAIWESSDVKPIPGLGGGFNIEKILNKRSDVFLGFSLGFRYLGGRTFGLNTSPTYDLANNKALNGTFNPAVNYDTVPGFFYANHKTFIQEGALELKMNFPSLEKRTGIIFHLWGGIGIGKYKTWIDALDKDGKMYNFSSLQSQSVSQSDLSRIFDKNYETLAQGSGTNGTLCFIPSIGIGLGYRLGKGVALVFEHKISFPGTNLLDGIEYPKNCPVTGSKDFYNYTSVGLVFTFYGGHHATQTGTTTNNTVYTNTTGTQTVTNTNNTNYTPPVVYPPTVVITYPANNYSSPYDYTTVNATLQNVSSSQQISISQNGYAINHFTFNAYNGTLHFQTFLSQGVNNFVVVASNQGGTASQGLTINYIPVQTFTATTIPTNTVVSTNTITTTTQTLTINTNTLVATNTVVTTHTAVATHTVAPTTTVSPTFTFSNTGTITPTNTVVPTFTSIATNTVVPNNNIHGTATAEVIKPIVTFIDPSVYPTETTSETYNVNATVFNISTNSQVSVTVNGNSLTQFTYNATTKTVSFLINLQLGYNTITITGTNGGGSDSKSAIINHKPTVKPPKVSITNPSSSPFTTLQNNVIISGYVYNVISSANITVTANGAPTTFNYNMSTHEINVPVYLTVSNTQVNISATNTFGSDAQSIELVFKKVVADSGTSANTGTGGNTTGGMGGIHGNHSKPEITVLSPVADPFYTNTGVVSVSANVNNVLDANKVFVSYNGIQVSFTYDINSKHLNFSSPLKPGLNTFVIDASNPYGAASKSININYTPINVNPNSGGNNNSSGPSYNHGGWNIGGIINNSGGNNNSTNNGGSQNPPPHKVNQDGGQANPPAPINTNPIQTTPRSINNDGGVTPGKSVGDGEQQIRPRPR